MNSKYITVIPYEKNINYQSYGFPLLCLFIATSLILTLCYWISNYNSFETAYTSWQKSSFIGLNGLLNNILPDYMWGQITQLGNAAVLMLLLSPLLLWRKYVWLSMLAAAPIAGIFSAIGKAMMRMPRPAAVLDPTTFHITGETLRAFNSLPSGHTISIFTCFSVLIILGYPITKKGFPQYWAKLQTFLLFFTAFIFALSRVAVGAHWQLDVLFGALIGFSAGILGTLLSLHFFKRKYFGKKSTICVSILLGVLVLTVINEYYHHQDFVLLLSTAMGIFTLYRFILRILQSAQ